ncbi:MAG: hypothetical protein IPK60_08535 [Sandaracinaceae bacterium]|nr:hypothetical protein [Sandaracinaceae bacterium]
MMGLGADTGTVDEPTQVPDLAAVSAMALGTSGYACAIAAATQQLFCWGSNANGQLGYDASAPEHYSAVPVCGPL